MTRLLAAVEAAIELVATDQEALVFHILDKTALIYKNNYVTLFLEYSIK